MYSKIRNDKGETRAIYRDSWYRLPQVQGCTEKLGYCESRLELFVWACECAGFDPYTSELIDGETGETLTYDDLETESDDMDRAANIEYTFEDDGTVTVEWYDFDAGLTIEYTGLQFRPITPRVTHVYDVNGIEPAYMGAVTAENDDVFKLALVSIIA